VSRIKNKANEKGRKEGRKEKWKEMCKTKRKIGPEGWITHIWNDCNRWKKLCNGKNSYGGEVKWKTNTKKPKS
jgi:hypothetical protein